MSVIALKKGDETLTHFSPSLVLEADNELLLIGSNEQVQRFIELFG